MLGPPIRTHNPSSIAAALKTAAQERMEREDASYKSEDEREVESPPLTPPPSSPTSPASPFTPLPSSPSLLHVFAPSPVDSPSPSSQDLLIRVIRENLRRLPSSETNLDWDGIVNDPQLQYNAGKTENVPVCAPTFFRIMTAILQLRQAILYIPTVPISVQTDHCPARNSICRNATPVVLDMSHYILFSVTEMNGRPPGCRTMGCDRNSASFNFPEGKDSSYPDVFSMPLTLLHEDGESCIRDVVKRDV